MKVTATHAGCVLNEESVGGALVIAVSGVLDVLTSPQLEASIAASLAKFPSAIIVDLSGVEFLASSGMGVLVSARDRAGSATKFGVVADGPATSRPLKLVGLADLIGLYPSLDEAFDALADQPSGD